LDELDKTKSIEQKLRDLLVREIKGRILKYEIMIKTFESKYHMSFQDFDQKDMIEKLGHTWDVERDYFDWEMATTELTHLKEILKRLTHI